MIIFELIKWINKKDKSISDLEPKTTFPVEITGGNLGDGQMSSRMAFRARVKSGREGRIIFRFATSEKQCSSHRLHIYLDEVEKIVTEWFGYSGNGLMSTPILNIDVESNKFHELKLQPEGKQEGCNQGFIAA